MKFKSHPYTVSSHFLSAIVNDDYSGLTNEESKQLIKFLSTLPGQGHWSIEETEGYFGNCEVTNLKSNVVDLEWKEVSLP